MTESYLVFQLLYGNIVAFMCMRFSLFKLIYVSYEYKYYNNNC